MSKFAEKGVQGTLSLKRLVLSVADDQLTNHRPSWEGYISSAVSAVFMLPFLQGLSLPSQGCWHNRLL